MKVIDEIKNMGMNDWFELFVKIYQKIRANPVNKITMIVLAIATGLISKPMILEIINEYFKTNYNFSFFGENDSEYGIYLITIALIFNLLSHSVVMLGEYYLKKRMDRLLDVALPYWQSYDTAIEEYRVVLNHYCHLVENKLDSGGKLEKRRFDIDKTMFEALNQLSLFLTSEETRLLRMIRVLVSKSLYAELPLYRHIWETYDKPPVIYTDRVREIFDRYYKVYLCIKEKYLKNSICDLESTLALNKLDNSYSPVLDDEISKITIEEFFSNV